MDEVRTSARDSALLRYAGISSTLSGGVFLFTLVYIFGGWWRSR